MSPVTAVVQRFTPASRRWYGNLISRIGLRSGILLILLCLLPSFSQAQSLRGGGKSVIEAYRIALELDYTFLRTKADVRRFVELELLVPLKGNADYGLDPGISHPYARPAVKTFVERLGAQHKEACGERLFVTSLTRPKSWRARNKSSLSVHPTGMAMDLRYSRTSSRCRAWLESTLLLLEGKGLLQATRENWPKHYHVVLYPHRYLAYLGVREAHHEPCCYAESKNSALDFVTRFTK
jgi:hypothetical protein